MRKLFPIITIMCLAVTTTLTSATTVMPQNKLNYVDTMSDEDLFNNPIIEKVEEVTEENDKEPEIIEITEIQKNLSKINNKFEIVQTIVGDEYENLNILVEQINELNKYVGENNDVLSSDKEVEAQVLKSLSTVEDSLNNLLKTFNVELTEENSFFEINGTITEINENEITIENEENTYKVTIDEKTLVKTSYDKNDNVTIKYSGSTTTSNIIIIDKCLSLVVAENML